MRTRIRIIAAGALALWASAGAPVRANIGLAARFGEIALENVKIGRTYNLREAARVPFGMKNMGSSPTDVVVEFLSPRAIDLSKGYEPVPDPSWFKALPEKITIGAGGIGFFDVLLTIPDDPKLDGRHFQAVIRGRMVGTGLLAAAIDNKIRFSIGAGPETLQAEKKMKAMQQLDFDVKPQSIYITDVPVGTKYDVRKEQKKSIRIANFSSDGIALQFGAEGWQAPHQLPEGYEPIPEPKWIVFKSSMVKVGGDEIGQIAFHIEIPKKDEYRGKKYGALIRTGLTTGYWLDAPVKVFITTKE